MATEDDFTRSASNDSGSVESLPDPEPEVSSLLECLVIVARDRGVELSVQSALRGQLLAPGSIGKEQIVQIARGAGLRASITRLSANDFSSLGPTLPVIVLLRNGE